MHAGIIIIVLKSLITGVNNYCFHALGIYSAAIYIFDCNMHACVTIIVNPNILASRY